MNNPLPAHLVAQWHPTLNGEITPDKVSAGSNKKAWWIGECGHEWEAATANRVYGRGCPYCSGKQILKGFNDLATLKPLVASQWNHEKNLPLTLETINGNSNKIVWWKNADCGHEWKMKVATRNDNVACSICDGYIILPGFNDLATLRPEIATEWHPTKNEKLSPKEVSIGSGRKVWWIGKDCNHEWEAIIKNRTQRGDGCLCCSGRMVITGVNDLATLKPELANEWHPTKNGALTPQTVSAGMGRKVWWLCASGHEWEATVYDRKKHEYKCSYCSGRSAIVGVNDLATVNPKLVLEWNIEKNLPYRPQDAQASTNRKVWWVCPKGHEWEAQVTGRSRGQGCPVCAANTYISRGEQKIADFIMAQGIDIKQSDRRTLSGVELDIYIPSKNMAIEFNGLYWHCDLKQTDTKYHYKKWLAAKNAGIQLIQIWEDEWNTNPEQIKAMLLHKLGITQQVKIYARKTRVEEIATWQAEAFFNTHHIQGFSSASYYLGLIDKSSDELCAVLALKKEKGKTLNIIRYATSKNVIGGFTKLLKYATNAYEPASFITFSDHCVSDGGLYANNGFTADKELAPDYRYVVRGKRAHKFGYRLKRFKDDPELLWQDGLTERELAILNKIPRIWDAGKTRWVMELQR